MIPYLEDQSSELVVHNHGDCCKSPAVYGCSSFEVAFPWFIIRGVPNHLSNEKKTGWLGYIRDYTTQLHRDYNIPYKDPY